MASHRHSSPSAPLLGAAMEACRIDWRRGYLTGRFSAWTTPVSGEPQLLGESPQLWTKRGSPPERTNAAVAALKTLVKQLADEGWEIADRDDATWYGYVLRRVALNLESRPVAAVTVVDELFSELESARRHAEEEQARRREAEQQLREAESRLVPAPVAVVPRVLEERPQKGFARLPLYLVGIVATAIAFLLAFHSGYAAAVAALTATALCLGIDGWIVARRR